MLNSQELKSRILITASNNAARLFLVINGSLSVKHLSVKYFELDCSASSLNMSTYINILCVSLAPLVACGNPGKGLLKLAFQNCIQAKNCKNKMVDNFVIPKCRLLSKLQSTLADLTNLWPVKERFAMFK